MDELAELFAHAKEKIDSNREKIKSQILEKLCQKFSISLEDLSKDLAFFNVEYNRCTKKGCPFYDNWCELNKKCDHTRTKELIFCEFWNTRFHEYPLGYDLVYVNQGFDFSDEFYITFNPSNQTFTIKIEDEYHNGDSDREKDLRSNKEYTIKSIQYSTLNKAVLSSPSPAQ